MIGPEQLSGFPPGRIRACGAALAAVIVLVSGAFAVDSYLDRRERIRVNAAQYQSAQDELEALSAKRRALQETAGQFEGLAEDGEDVLTPTTVNELAAGLTRLAERKAVRTRTIREVAGGERGGAVVNLTGEFSGDYAAVDAFMDAVHATIPSAHMRRVRLAAESENEQGLTVSVTIAWHRATSGG